MYFPRCGWVFRWHSRPRGESSLTSQSSLWRHWRCRLRGRRPNTAPRSKGRCRNGRRRSWPLCGTISARGEFSTQGSPRGAFGGIWASSCPAKAFCRFCNGTRRSSVGRSTRAGSLTRSLSVGFRRQGRQQGSLWRQQRLRACQHRGQPLPPLPPAKLLPAPRAPIGTAGGTRRTAIGGKYGSQEGSHWKPLQRHRQGHWQPLQRQRSTVSLRQPLGLASLGRHRHRQICSRLGARHLQSTACADCLQRHRHRQSRCRLGYRIRHRRRLQRQRPTRPRQRQRLHRRCLTSPPFGSSQDATSMIWRPSRPLRDLRQSTTSRYSYSEPSFVGLAARPTTAALCGDCLPQPRICRRKQGEGAYNVLMSYHM